MRLLRALSSVIATACVAGIALLAFAGDAAATRLATYRIVGDEVPERLDGIVGDAARGRQIVLDRNVGNCLICHAVPEPRERFMGDVGPDLAGVGERLGAGQIRLRLIDSSRVAPTSVMPPYYRVEGLQSVGAPWRDKPVLTSRQIEDVVAYLVSLKSVD